MSNDQLHVCSSCVLSVIQEECLLHGHWYACPHKIYNSANFSLALICKHPDLLHHVCW